MEEERYDIRWPIIENITNGFTHRDYLEFKEIYIKEFLFHYPRKGKRVFSKLKKGKKFDKPLLKIQDFNGAYSTKILETFFYIEVHIFPAIIIVENKKERDFFGQGEDKTKGYCAIFIGFIN